MNKLDVSVCSFFVLLMLLEDLFQNLALTKTAATAAVRGGGAAAARGGGAAAAHGGGAATSRIK